MDDGKAIGVLDSGFGGLWVVAEVARLAPGERFLYYADFENAPYGAKEAEEVEGFVRAACDRLLAGGAKALVLACNTATSAAVANLRARLDVPVIGMEPALKPAVEAHPDGRVVVMATPLTLRERKYRELLERFGRECEVVELPCPGLAGAVDTGDLGAAGDWAVELLGGCQGARDADAVVLGCSHYAFVANAVRSWYDHDIDVFDGAEGTARRLVAVLRENGLMSGETSETGEPLQDIGERVEWLLPGAPPSALETGRRLLGTSAPVE